MHINFDSTLLEAFEELDKLYEDTSNKEASKLFWAAAKENKIDEKAFHAAFDSELAELGLMSLFNNYGILYGRGSYSKIKNAKVANPDSWAVKALNKLWILQFVNNVKTDAQIKLAQEYAAEQAEYEAKKAEQKRQKEEAHKAMVQEWLDILPKALNSANQTELNKFLNITKLSTADFTFDIKKDGGNYVVEFLATPLAKYIYRVDIKTADKVAELANIIDRAVTYSIKDYYKESNKAIDVFAFTEPAWTTAVLLGDSGKLYKINNDSNYLADVTEPYKVIYTRTYWTDNNHITYKNSYSYDYYSWDSAEEDKLVGMLPTIGVKRGVHSETNTTVADGNSKWYSHMDNIDTWAVEKYTAYSTD